MTIKTAALVTVLIGAMLVVGVPARGDWHENDIEPHPATHKSWAQVEPDDVIYHNHHYHDGELIGPGPDAIPGHENGHELLGAVQFEHHYDPYSVWVDETYWVYDTSGGGVVQEYFSHGFIREAPEPTPEYEFDGDNFTLKNHLGVWEDMRPYVRSAFAAWSGINVDDTEHLRMGLAFREYDPDEGDFMEITVTFVDSIVDAAAAWYPGSRTLKFARYNDEAKTDPIIWYTGESLADMLTTTAEMDMETVAMHEIGHIVGLDHQLDYDDVLYEMSGGIGAYTIFGENAAFRSFSQDDILGARDLYSIPIPEPLSLALLASGGLALLRRRR